MELQGSLSKFRQQQAKVQSMLTGSVSRLELSMGSRSQKSTSAIASSPLQQKTPSSATKFSDELERLQQINRMKNSPAGAQVKRVIDLLLKVTTHKKTREAFTAEQIHEASYIEIKGNKDVFDLLRGNVKVNYDGKYYSYKPTHSLQNKDELLKLIQKFPEGISTKELEDAYPKVMEDLKTLKADGQIWLLTSMDSENFAYPNDPKLVSIKVDKDLKQFFHEIKLPGDMMDIEDELRKSRIKPVTDTAQRRLNDMVPSVPQKGKTQRKKHHRRLKAVTNFHLLELFPEFREANK